MCIKPPLPSRTHWVAKQLRTVTTDAECALWYRLRAGRLNGYKFRRQHPVPPYIVDFYCDELKLVIELDGSQHNPRSDATRSRALINQGLLTLRFWDNQVLLEMDSVLKAILDVTRVRTLTPTPLPKGEGL